MHMTFGIGNVLGTGFRVWLRNLIPFLLITGLFHAPPWLWALSAVHGSDGTSESLLHAAQVVQWASYLNLPLGVFVTATLTYGVVMELHGQRASIGACIATGFARFLPALGVGILTCLCVGVASIALVIPGIIVLCMLYVSTPVSVVERPGMMASLNRSSELTKGHRWEIFCIVFLLALLAFAVAFVTGMFSATLLRPRELTLESLPALLSKHVYFTYAHQVMTGSLTAVISAVVYVFLRAEKDGTSTAELAAIFD